LREKNETKVNSGLILLLFDILRIESLSSCGMYQLSEQEDLIVWMRTAALPTFRKLYGKIETDIEDNEEVMLVIENNYNTYEFGARKSIVLSTTAWVGGRNHFLGMAYILIGGISLLLAVGFLLLYVMQPR